MVPTLMIQTLGNQDQSGPQGFQLRSRDLFANAINAFVPGNHEGDHEEEVHGLEAVAKVIQSDEGLESLSGIVHNLIRGGL
jgi:hypothetical protein